jgi:hypothetical protein
VSVPELILTAIVAVVGIPSARKNPTAAALVGCWLFSQMLYWFTGDGMKTEYFAWPDVAVIATIMVKTECRKIFSDELTNSWLAEMKCKFLECAPADRFILCTYPICWVLYVMEHSRFTYLALVTISVAQFLATGLESLFAFLRRHAEAPNSPPEHLGDLRVAYAFGGGGGG